MFGSQILEVGIGLILVFLLVSLILTAVREAIESFAKTRARDLELAIAELLKDRDGTGLRMELYKHPLVYSLFPGGLAATKFDAAGKVLKRAAKNVPSYIPREVFSAALQDILKKEMARAREPGAEPHEDAAAGADSRASGTAHVIQAYQALLEVAGGDPERIRKGIEGWYDASMDRASGWFKRRTQTMLFLLGFGVAVALNVNAITIAQYLATHKEAAALMAGTAGQFQADYGNAAATTEEGQERDQSAELARRLDDQVRAVGLPIGWDQVQLHRIGDEFRSNPVWALISLLLGYAMVGFAATLGAPFWFDLLGKFMVVRSTVKPTEKSPDEVSKDGGTGGSPKPPKKEEDEDEEGG